MTSHSRPVGAFDRPSEMDEVYIRDRFADSAPDGFTCMVVYIVAKNFGRIIARHS